MSGSAGPASGMTPRPGGVATTNTVLESAGDSSLARGPAGGFAGSAGSTDPPCPAGTTTPRPARLEPRESPRSAAGERPDRDDEPDHDQEHDHDLDGSDVHRNPPCPGRN